MTNQHPITPPLELLKQWEDDWFEEREHADVLLIQAFQAGADQELEACCEWLNKDWNPCHSRELRAARRSKPPSLKEQALTALGLIETDNVNTVSTFCESINTVRRALEALPDD